MSDSRVYVQKNDDAETRDLVLTMTPAAQQAHSYNSQGLLQIKALVMCDMRQLPASDSPYVSAVARCCPARYLLRGAIMQSSPRSFLNDLQQCHLGCAELGK